MIKSSIKNLHVFIVIYLKDILIAEKNEKNVR